MYRMTAVFLLAFVMFNSAFEFENCSKDGKFTDVTLSACNKDEKACKLKAGTNSTIDITFKSNRNIADVNAWIGTRGIEPFVLPVKEKACSDENSGLKCPVQKDESEKYSTTLVIGDEYKGMVVTLVIRLGDAKKGLGPKTFLCVSFPAEFE